MSEPGTECPKCRAASPCVDWNEVDIGVGVQKFEHEYECPTHGRFAFVHEPGALFASPAAIFQDDHE